MTTLYLNFLLFAVVISITPGPTNLIALTLGHRYGINSAFAFIISAASSASLILLLTSQGICQCIYYLSSVTTNNGLDRLYMVNLVIMEIILDARYSNSR
ncbi:hypothetical protein [Moritella sp. PE36]|uniref:hypothetical protein n=1 Tax=Moritella sp. PE36 TaxID=58051 RepID=UPI000319EF1C|nr:hypothetical protein [Moritella sp. PE36]